MERSFHNAAAVAVFILAIAGVAVVIALTQTKITGILRIAIPAGWILIVLGCLIDAWALAQIRGGVWGRVKPLRGHLVQQGPYRYVRHPVYLGLFAILVGIALRLGSWPGVGTAVVFFIPAVIYRARLEEAALRTRFGQEWSVYCERTGFLLPRIGRSKTDRQVE